MIDFNPLNATLIVDSVLVGLNIIILWEEYTGSLLAT